MPQTLTTMDAQREDAFLFRGLMSLFFILPLLFAAVPQAGAGSFHLEVAYCDIQSGPLTTLPDGNVPLADGYLGQVIVHLTDGAIPPPDDQGRPGGNDRLLSMQHDVLREDGAAGTFLVNGVERLDAAGYFIIDPVIEGLERPASAIYVRIWNAADPVEATYYYDTPLYDLIDGVQQMNFARDQLTMHAVNGALSVGSEAEPAVPVRFNVLSGYPNPFNTEATLEYAVERAAHVGISLYDIQGRQTVELVNAEVAPGEHRVRLSATDLPTGTYFAVLQVNGARVSTQRMMLLK